ncbi:MAG: zinc ribbon domain-containing protein [Chloroflexota bacterium]|nr:zinc ribbon domain-containing protein [Chloroflexota bacterium]
MPIYEYVCPKCDLRFELRRSFSEADEATLCPSCNSAARKLLSKFCATSKGSDGDLSSIAGMGSSCGTCSATDCSTCNLGH